MLSICEKSNLKALVLKRSTAKYQGEIFRTENTTSERYCTIFSCCDINEVNVSSLDRYVFRWAGLLPVLVITSESHSVPSGSGFPMGFNHHERKNLLV